MSRPGSKRTVSLRGNKGRPSIPLYQTRTETVLRDGAVVVPGVTGPAGPKDKGNTPGIRNSMSILPTDIVQRSGRHRLAPCLAAAVHLNQHAVTGNRTVIFSSRAIRVEVSVGHEIFVADFARRDRRHPPEQSPFRTCLDRRPPANTVNFAARFEVPLRGLVPKDLREIA